jgi:DNA gyrase/topoisomerase IV subunit B
MTDADVDVVISRPWILTFFFRRMRALIEKGMCIWRRAFVSL